MNSERVSIFKNIVSTESAFVAQMKQFIDLFVVPLYLRDNSFKRSLLDEPSIATTFNSFVDIHAACSTFLSAVKKSKSGAEMAEAYSQFASSLVLFSHYIAENTATLNALATFSRQITEYSLQVLPTGISVENCIVLPCEHYLFYKTSLEQFVTATPRDAPEYEVLKTAFAVVCNACAKVDEKQAEENRKAQLLYLQQQFKGNPVIFKQNRIFVREIAIERIKAVNEKLVSKPYYAHLFDDALIISSVTRLGYHVFCKQHDLVACKVEPVDIDGFNYCFSVTGGATNDKVPHVYKVGNEADFIVFVETMQSLILAAEKAHAASLANQDRQNDVAVLHNGVPVNASALSARTAIVFSFIKSERALANELCKLCAAMINPLFNASKGAALVANTEKANARNKAATAKRSSAFSIMEGRLANMTTNQIKDVLQSSDLQIFLRAIESLSNQLNEFLNNLEAAASNANWGDGMIIGTVFTSVLASAIYKQYESYVSGQQAAMRILKGTVFKQFIKDIEDEFNVTTIFPKLDVPRNGPNRYLEFLEKLMKKTPNTNPDYKPLESGLATVQKVVANVTEVVRGKCNFEKLLEVQSCFVSIVQDPVVAKLASMDRTFIRQGELKKVCRKENKRFMFWLFNDYLLYATSVGISSYSLNHAIPLENISVTTHTSTDCRNAFDLHGVEKSFTVICSSGEELSSWMASLNDAISACKAAKGIKTPNVSAAIWVADKHSDQCSVCNAVSFVLFVQSNQGAKFNLCSVEIYIVLSKASLSSMWMCSMRPALYGESGNLTYSPD